LKGGQAREAANIQNRSIEFVLFLTLPAAAGLWILSDAIIRVLYERGAFSADNTAVVGGILAIYGVGLPGFVLIKALQPGFYAREDTKTPMRFTILSVMVNSGLAISLFPLLAERGIATAEAVAGWINTVLLFATLVWRGHLVWDWQLARRTLLLLLSAAVMAGALVYALPYAAPWLSPGSSLVQQVLALALLVGFAMIVYFGVAFLTGGADLGMIRRNIRRRPKTSP
jgi:putative peptidoglycan lipid II flippase